MGSGRRAHLGPLIWRFCISILESSELTEASAFSSSARTIELSDGRCRSTAAPCGSPLSLSCRLLARLLMGCGAREDGATEARSSGCEWRCRGRPAGSDADAGCRMGLLLFLRALSFWTTRWHRLRVVRRRGSARMSSRPGRLCVCADLLERGNDHVGSCSGRFYHSLLRMLPVAKAFFPQLSPGGPSPGDTATGLPAPVSSTGGWGGALRARSWTPAIRDPSRRMRESCSGISRGFWWGLRRPRATGRAVMGGCSAQHTCRGMRRAGKCMAHMDVISKRMQPRAHMSDL